MVQSVLGGCKLDRKFTVQSNTPLAAQNATRVENLVPEGLADWQSSQAFNSKRKADNLTKRCEACTARSSNISTE